MAGWLTWRYAPEASGHGTDSAIDAFHNKRGEIALRVPIIKAIASAITLGTAGSAGREGPIAQIGAGFGACLATWLKLSARDRRILLAAGMGAGVGAIFRAPLAGALFAGEILYRDAELEADVIMPAAVASTIAYSIFCFSLPSEYRFLICSEKTCNLTLLRHSNCCPMHFWPWCWSEREFPTFGLSIGLIRCLDGCRAPSM